MVLLSHILYKNGTLNKLFETRIKTFQTNVSVLTTECVSFRRIPIQSSLHMYSSIPEPLMAYHTVSHGGSIGFVCPKIHFIDISGECQSAVSIKPNSLLLISCMTNFCQEWMNEIVGHTHTHTHRPGTFLSSHKSVPPFLQSQPRDTEWVQFNPTNVGPVTSQVAPFG